MEMGLFQESLTNRPDGEGSLIFLSEASKAN